MRERLEKVVREGRLCHEGKIMYQKVKIGREFLILEEISAKLTEYADFRLYQLDEITLLYLLVIYSLLSDIFTMIIINI